MGLAIPSWKVAAAPGWFGLCLLLAVFLCQAQHEPGIGRYIDTGEWSPEGLVLMQHVFIKNDWTQDVSRCVGYACELEAEDLGWSIEVVYKEANGLTLCRVRITDEDGELVGEGYPSFSNH